MWGEMAVLVAMVSVARSAPKVPIELCLKIEAVQTIPARHPLPWRVKARYGVEVGGETSPIREFKGRWYDPAKAFQVEAKAGDLGLPPAREGWVLRAHSLVYEVLDAKGRKVFDFKEPHHPAKAIQAPPRVVFLLVKPVFLPDGSIRVEHDLDVIEQPAIP